MKPESVFPACFSCVKNGQQEKLLGAIGDVFIPEHFPPILAGIGQSIDFPPYLVELANLELALFHLKEMRTCWP